MSTWPFSRKAWFQLPLRLRQRWWRETNYSTREPPPALLETVMRILMAARADG
jgi:hypothetical protein